MRPLRPQQHRVHYFAARLPLSRWGSRSVCPTSRQGIPKAGDAGTAPLLQGLAEVTRERHGKFGETVYHLEPNLKETPGGLRDYNVACWLALISAMDKLHDWPDASSLRAPVRRQLEAALEFLMSARCFLHFRHGRDDNTLSWEAQDEAAARRIGVADSSELSAADWMRIYFGHARAVQRTVAQLLEEIPGSVVVALSSISKLAVAAFHAGFFGGRWTDFSAAAFRAAGSGNVAASVSLHGAPRPEVEHDYGIPHRTGIAGSGVDIRRVGAELWLYLQETLLQPHAADALRAMHSLRLLTLLLPELKLIDSLVVRDFYHRFTVDEHSFLAIESLHRLRQSQSEWDKRYAELLGELEDPELLYLALLLHDTGKGVPGGNHVEASLDIAGRCLDRLDVDPERAGGGAVSDRQSSGNVGGSAPRYFQSGDGAAFAEKVGTPERLKMLCLLTYADIKAVNPEALTPWKAENVWQLYIGAANYLNRSADQRVHARCERRKTGPAAVAGAGDRQQVQGVSWKDFRSVISACIPRKRVMRHMEMAEELANDPVQVELKRGRHWYELTLVTSDRPFFLRHSQGCWRPGA